MSKNNKMLYRKEEILDLLSFLNKFKDFFNVFEKDEYTIEYDSSRKKFITNIKSNKSGKRYVFKGIKIPDYTTFEVLDSAILIEDYPSNMLPDNLTIPNYLSYVTIIQNKSTDKLKIGKNTIINYLTIQNVNIDLNNIKVISYLNMTGNQFITQLPDNFEISHRFYANNSQLKTLKNVKINKLVDIINISHSKINYIEPQLIQNLNHLFHIEIEGLVIENIQELMKIYSRPFFSLSYYVDKDFLPDSFYREKTIDVIKNVLLYKSKSPIQKKLLLEQFDTITNFEIKKAILKEKLYKKFFKKSKKLKLINYCFDNTSLEFLYKNGYDFTEEEYKNLQNPYIINIYEKFLLKQKIKIPEDGFFKIESKTKNNIIKNKKVSLKSNII